MSVTMKGMKTAFTVLAFSALALAAVSATPTTSMKKGILVVSFGTSYESTMKTTIGAAESAIAAAFPDREVRRAFTSTTIIRILGKRGIAVDTVDSALEKMAKEGFGDIVVQALHLIPGEEFHELLAAVAPWRGRFASFVVGTPLLAAAQDYFALADAFIASLPAMVPGEAAVLMGHGTPHPANMAYPALQRVFDDRQIPIYLGTVEGYPTLEDVIADLTRDGVKKVLLVPLMLVAGDHANNDMAGDEPDSWKSILSARGFEVSVMLRGLGELPEVRALYIGKVRAALSVSGKH